MKMRSAPLAGLVLALLPAGAGAATQSGIPGSIAISDEQTTTRWGTPVQLAYARERPAPGARRVTRLRYFTEDGYPEAYIALRSVRDARGRLWLLVRLPRRPNGSRGWVPAAAMGELRIVRTRLTIDRTKLRATLKRNGEVIWTAPVGVGARGTPTPSGPFWIRERIKVRGSGGTYGPWAFGTSAYSRLTDWPGGGVVGIHGTNQPGLIPGRPSHGCIRVRNGDIRRLAALLPVGTPVRIL